MRPSDIPTVVAGTRTDELDDELLVYAEHGNSVITLNPLATVVWGLCDGTRDIEEIEAVLAGAYPEAGDRIPRDVADTIRELVERKVLELVVAN